jgi:hypothetical protein
MFIAREADGALAEKRAGDAWPSGGVESVFYIGPEQCAAAGEGFAAPG